MATKEVKDKNLSVNMVDMTKKLFVRIKFNKTKNIWEKFVSKDKKNWELAGKLESLEEVFKSQQEIVDSNYQNLFNLITKK